MKNIGMFLERINKVIPFLFIGLFLLFACEKFSFDPPKADPGKIYSFQLDIQPLFTSKCIGCHASGKQQPTLEDGKSYSSLTNGGYISSDPVNSPETSILYIQVTTNPSHTPLLNDLQKQSILEWIRQGALNN